MANKPAKTLEVLPNPPKENLNSHFTLGEIIDLVHLLQDEFPHVKIDLLKTHLWEIRNKNVEPENHLRGFLSVFEETDVFKEAFEQLDDGMKIQLKTFIAGGSEEVVLAAGVKGNAFHLPPSPPVKHHFKLVTEKLKARFEGVFHPGKQTNGVDGVSNGKIENHWLSSESFLVSLRTRQVLRQWSNKEFQNWGQTVRNIPLWTFVPKTALGLCNLVKWAKVHDFRGGGGYRHSWSSTFSEDKQILVSLLNLEEVTKLPDAMSIEAEHIDPENELKVIQFVSPPGAVANNTEKALVRMGVSVTNEQFRRWAVANDKWALPVDVILVEVTIGGVNGPICHGAGRNHQTLNDYVRAVEFVDANGEHRIIKAAAGHFGLMGIVTHITYEVDKMSYAVLKPIKPDIGLAIPPFHREDIPIALRKTFTDAQYAAALNDFKNRAENDYYSEWFWFTRSQQAWVNTWNPTDDKTDVVEYPSPFLTWCQWVEGWLGMVMTTNPIFQAFPGRWQAEILATLGMVNLPHFEFTDFHQEPKKETIKCALPNALHFRRGIQNMRTRDLEFQISIPALPSNPSKPDYSIVQRAWWDIINLCYENDDCPMRLTMELRIMGDSKIIMAPQTGNVHGTASLEVLSIPDVVSDDEWVPFLQRVVNLWLGYRDGEGVLLNVRPHWAKECINMRGKPARQYLKEDAYRDAIPKFKSELADIGKAQGWELKDIQRRFSNEMWDYIIYS